MKPVDARVPRQAHAVRLSAQEASGVTIFIVNDGFSVYGLDRNRVGTGCEGTEFPTIPRVQGSPDYAGLSRCLHQLVVGETPVPLAITANPGTDLQTLVSVVDAASDANPVAFPSTFSAKVPASPGPSTGNGAETPATGSLPTAASTVRGLQESFRACYDTMLTRRPDSTGGVRLSMRVGEDGSVQSVTASPSGTVDEQLVACVRQVAMSARFDRPTGGPVALVVPITFQPKDAKPRSPACRRAEP